jgi:predicted transcriptional regulator
VRLAETPDDAGAVARDLEVSRQAVAKHVRILEDAGLVHSTWDARRRVHDVDAARIAEVSDLLGVVARGWGRRLEGIKAEAERREQQG